MAQSNYYSKPKMKGYFDLRIADVENKNFDLSNMRAFRFENDTKNRYFIDGKNRISAANMVCHAISIAWPETNLNALVFDFVDRPVQKAFVSFGEVSYYIDNADICWLKDTRYTATGRVSKNAYELYYHANFKGSDPRFFQGWIKMTPEGYINRAQVVFTHEQIEVKIVKEENGRLVVGSHRIDGESAYNT